MKSFITRRFCSLSVLRFGINKNVQSNYKIPLFNNNNFIQITKSRAHDEYIKPQNPPKYFGIDLDGTFFTEVKESLNKNLKALERIKNLGFTPIFCTGRTLYSTLYLLNNLKERSGYNGYPGVYACGCLVLDKDGSVIRSIEFIPETLKIICNYLEDNNLFPNTTFITLSRPLKCTEYIEELEMRCIIDRCPPSVLMSKQDLLKESIMTVIIYSNYDLTNIKIPGLENGKDFIVTRSSHDKYEITPPGGSKTEGLKILMEHFGEEPSSCAYIGDHENDIEIMKLSNLSFAVNNADDYVKREAKYYVNLTNNEAAVAYTLQKIYGFTL